MPETEAATIHALAGEAYDWFEQAKRPDDETFTRLKDGAPEWLGDLVHEAHGDFLPDDWRYETIQDALGAIHDAGAGSDLDDVRTEFADSVDVYTSDLFKWLSSNLTRQGYCDDAREEGLVSDDADITQRIAIGQYTEREEVFQLVRESLEARLESLEDDC